MSFIEWSDDYSVGVELFDQQHKGLVDLINKLHEAMSEGKSRTVMASILDDLVKYTVIHFTSEEELFHKHHYPLDQEHTQQHQALTEQVLKFKHDFDNGQVMISVYVLDFLKKWLIEHIQGADMRYKDFFNKQGIY